MEALFGSKLLTKDGEVDTETALGGADVVGIYFSAHWCPPCRGYTPVLADKYKELKAAGKSFEIVFASSDNSEKEFDEYYGEHPWLAIPFAARKEKEALSRKFKVQGIPTLVLLNADGSTITKDGREAVMENEYPFTPPALADLLEDDVEIMTKNGPESLKSIRDRTTHLGLYFSAHWCPPCKKFTPQLAQLYKTVQAKGEKFEVIFFSSDRSSGDFDGYYGEMPWAALPYGNRELREKISGFFGVRGIPTFVVLESATLDTVNANARGAVADKTGEKFPWAPPAAANLDEDPEGINDNACVVALFEEAPDEWEAVTAALTTVAKEVRDKAKADGEEQDIVFKYVEEPDGLGQKVRELAKLKRPQDGKVEVVVMNIPDGNFHVVETPCTTADDFRALVADFRAGKTKMVDLR